ncbi:hypothetical protein yinte0001_19090 [Yersinia intermedia ATCC 29909]|nr:hypothetical protein yinte0001_19090 [Yersinia intermedia ATCC 29909]
MAGYRPAKYPRLKIDLSQKEIDCCHEAAISPTFSYLYID